MLFTVAISRQSRLFAASAPLRHSSITSPCCCCPPTIAPSRSRSTFGSMLSPPSNVKASSRTTPTIPAPPPTATPRPDIPRRSSTCVGSSFARFRKRTGPCIPSRGGGANRERLRQRRLRHMLIEDSFTVHTPVDRLWAFLQDVERIAPCMPGAELTETVDDHTWKGRVHVKFGPVQMTFSGTVTMDERDDEAHRAKLSAKGTEQRGKGAASAGAAAQLSRGLLPDVSKLLTKKFADCLQSTLEQEGAAPTARSAAATTES